MLKVISSKRSVLSVLMVLMLLLSPFIILGLQPAVKAAGAATVNAYPKPASSNLPSYTGLSVSVNGTALNLYTSDWRNVGQFEYSGTPAVTVTCPVNISSVTIRPSIYGISYSINGKTCTFTMPDVADKKSMFEVSVKGTDSVTRVVDILGDPIETDKPSSSDPDVYYFGSGVSTPGTNGLWTLENVSNKTIYIDRGAVLQARVKIKNCSNITIKGRGVFRDSLTAHESVSSLFWIENVNNLTFKDIMMTQAHNHQIFLTNVHNATLSNLKQAASDGNTDGITVNSACTDILADNCYLCVNDDALVMNSDSVGENDADNIVFQNMVLANLNNGFKLNFRGYSYGVLNNVTFKNIYGIQSPGPYGWMESSYNETCGIWLKRLKNLRFENVYIENAGNNKLMDFTSQNPGKSSLEHYGYITYKNCYLPGKPSINAPRTATVVLDHCYYGSTPIASSADLSSLSGGATIQYITGSSTPPAFTPPATPIIALETPPTPGGPTVQSGADVTITEYNGTSQDLRVKHYTANYFSARWNKNAFVKFNLAGAGVSHVTTARLWLHSDYYVNAQNKNNPVQVYEVTDDSWSETNISWPGPAMGTLQTEKVVTAYGWVSFDVTAAVNNALAGDKIISLGLRHKNDGSREYNEFSGREDNNVPYIELIP